VETLTIPCRVCWLTYWEPRPWPVAAGKWLRWRTGRDAVRRIASWLGERQPDVVHVNCLPHLWGAEAARVAGRPVVWHLREILPPGTRRRWFARRLEREADRIVAVSEAVATWVREEGVRRPVEVVYNGVDTEGVVQGTAEARRAVGLPDDGIVVGLFGQLLPHKGVLDFVRAAARVLDTRPDARFLIAGDGPPAFRAEVDAAIAAVDRGDRIRRIGPRADAASLFAAADLVALTTRTPDPLPRSVMEAASHGRPVVAYRSGGVCEMVDDGETGLLVEAGDFEALARAIAELAGDATRRQTMGRLAAERAGERFAVARHVERMERELAEAAGS
jgi:glycosyltransferase involved in cell wall biosynthesis